MYVEAHIQLADKLREISEKVRNGEYGQGPELDFAQVEDETQELIDKMWTNHDDPGPSPEPAGVPG